MNTKQSFACDINTTFRRLYWIIILISAGVLPVGCKQKQAPPPDGLRVPEGYTIERATPRGMVTYPMFASFDNKGRLFVVESNGTTTSTEEVLEYPAFFIRVLEDMDGDGVYDSSRIFADKIAYPMGAAFYQGSLYVAAPPDLLRFTDTDGDGTANEREVILTGWTLNHNAATLGGPFLGPDGWLYMTDARRGFNIKTKEGDSLKGKSARIWRCRPDGTGLESVSGGGFDNTIELIFMPSGETIGTMTYFTDPKEGFRDALMHWVEGGVYPKPQEAIEQDHLKLTGSLMPVMTKLARVSHAGLMRYRGSSFGQESKGNLFSAQFNTGRVMRHIVIPDGATYRTLDEPFMQSDSLDMHPTDVLEDADGSLLVVNTGGWFIAGCPLSVVAKTNIMGGIYRIRKTGAPVAADAWGKQTDFTQMSAEALVKYLDDPRIAVRDNVIEQLVLSGEAAVNALRKMPQPRDEELRTAVVFALSRIRSANAMNDVRLALEDTSVMVRIAAARALGLAKDRTAVDKLMKMVQEDEPSARRQSATALGEIGDERCIDALLNAVLNPNDRFTEHAIIYALITLGKPDPLLKALYNSSADICRVAMIALDQMDGTPLHKDHLTAFLTSADTVLRNTGIWVAGHHPEWNDVVTDFIQSRLQLADLPEADLLAVRELLLSFCNSIPLQNTMARQLNQEATPAARKLFLMEVISGCSVKELPAVWVSALSNLLKDADLRIRLEVLGLIESRGISLLNNTLNQIIQDTALTVAFRLKAFSARIKSAAKLSNAEFLILLKYMGAGQELPVRQSALRLLGQANMSDVQLLTLAKEQVEHADDFLLPGLVNTFDGNTNEATGKALVSALLTATDRLDNLPVQDLQKLFDAYPASVQVMAKPLMETLHRKQSARLLQLQQLEAKLKRGDILNGRQLFFGKATCFTCHAVGAEGGNFGPDLTNIGEIRSRHDILEAILFPGASFAREHETVKVVTQTNTYTGIITEQLPDAIIVAEGPGSRVRVARAGVISIEPQRISMMPPGLDKILTIEDLSDLIVYLTALPNGLGQLKSH